MHGMHARTPKHFVLEERLERYASAIELRPDAWAGRWARACWPLGGTDAGSHADAGSRADDQPRADAGGFSEVRLDLGCGKGAFLVASARREPDVLFVGMDAEPLCIAYTAQHIVDEGLANAVVVPARGSQVASAFGPHEISCIHLNFPTPYPRKKEAPKRLVALERLLEYRDVLAPGGTLRLRTDSQPLRDFALTQLALARYDIVWASDDERAQRPDEPTSEYEERLCAQGARVYGVWATPNAQEKPHDVVQTASLSLVDYLPDDLFANGYVPYGMNGTITNLRNRAIRADAALGAAPGPATS